MSPKANCAGGLAAGVSTGVVGSEGEEEAGCLQLGDPRSGDPEGVNEVEAAHWRMCSGTITVTGRL